MPRSCYRSRRAPSALLGALAAMLLCPLPAASARAAQATANPSADVMLFGGEPALNYGGAGQLSIADAGQLQGQYQSLLRFDLADIKSSFDATFGAGQWTLESATLRLNTNNPNNPNFNPNSGGAFSMSWMQNDNWIEGTGNPMSPTTDGATFAMLLALLSPQDQPLGTFTFPGGNSGANTYTLDLAPGLTADVESGAALSLRLFPAEGEALAYNFSSRSFQTAANRPLLTLTAVAVPEPAAGLLAAASAVALLRRRAHNN